MLMSSCAVGWSGVHVVPVVSACLLFGRCSQVEVHNRFSNCYKHFSMGWFIFQLFRMSLDTINHQTCSKEMYVFQ